MQKILALLRSKKFWTLVTAIVAALSAFFLTSCTGFFKMQRSGVHHDTVKYEQIIKHKNFKSAIVCIDEESKLRNPFTSQPSMLFRFFLGSVTPSPSFEESISFASIHPPLIGLKRLFIHSTISISAISIMSNPNCLMVPALFSSTSPGKKSSNVFSAIMIANSLPLTFIGTRQTRRSRRRGGRRGRPKPSTKTVNLGGSHL